VLVKRIAINDYTFSDGQRIPAGTTLAAPACLTHFDPSVYENPLEFDGFRFVKMKEDAILDGKPNKQFGMISISAQFLPFSLGRHACPGRFFAAVEIKMMLAYMLMTYDMKLVDGVRPPDIIVMNSPVANPSAEVLFRRRQ
jgi:cytochrome P450